MRRVAHLMRRVSHPTSVVGTADGTAVTPAGSAADVGVSHGAISSKRKKSIADSQTAASKGFKEQKTKTVKKQNADATQASTKKKLMYRQIEAMVSKAVAAKAQKQLAGTKQADQVFT